MAVHQGKSDLFKFTITDEQGASVTLFLKRNWRVAWTHGLRLRLGRTGARSFAGQEWNNMAALRRAGVDTVGLVAYAEEHNRLWETFSAIITEAAAGTPMEVFIRSSDDREQRRRAFLALAALVRRMHDAGFAAPDLFMRHIFLNFRPAEPEFSLIDMARLDHREVVSARLRARDLASLHASAPLRFVSVKERLLFLKAYSGFVDRRLVQGIARRMKRLLKRRKFRHFLALSDEAPQNHKPRTSAV